MSGTNNIVLDTNIVLYILAGEYDLSRIPEGTIFISFITELELLSYPKLSKNDERKIQDFLSGILKVGIQKEIKEKTIMLRKKYSIKLPDAMIAATALVLKATLISNDKHFKKIAEITVL